MVETQKPSAESAAGQTAREQYVVMVRHMERLDGLEGQQEFDERPFGNKWDTPLSYLGFKQAFQTGECLKSDLIEKIEARGVTPKVKIFSSPFTRCLQSASGIIKGLGSSAIICDDSIQIKEELSEAQQSVDFTKIEDLELNKLGSTAFIEQHIKAFPDHLTSTRDLQIVNPREKDDETSKYFKMQYSVSPEPMPQVSNTYRRYLKFLLESPALFTDEDKSAEVVILVTHGHAIEACLHLLAMGKTKSLEQIYFDDKFFCCNVNYGATTILRYDDLKTPKWTVEGDFASSQHLYLGKAQAFMVKDDDSEIEQVEDFNSIGRP